jgi:hypothetical protein
MTTRISIDLDDLTWGELITFVDAARSADVGFDDKVNQVSDLHDGTTISQFELVFHEPLPHQASSIPPAAAEQVRFLLGMIRQQDGDARGLLPQIDELLLAI